MKWEKARLVVEWVDQADTMTLYCESTSRDEALVGKIQDTIREQCKVRGSVELVAPGSLAKDGIVIEDSRKYD